ncbi:YfjI family protein [Rhodopirellula sp. P2]|uniref:YfjI family protein n=1 Tax=Rhodopirellula sp. P2 TaxID=2127060 RepID=UPI002367E5F4|nr:YfjI family protein [Rhodopirellula sp. P2]WDQ19014.1 YfjI family protein [Rhodopirellula sp. P2]
MTKETNRSGIKVAPAPHVDYDEIDRRAQDDAGGVTWGEPDALPDELRPVMPYVSELLPSSIGRAVDDIAERMQCPPDYPAASMLVAMAAVVGCRLGIRPRMRDDWLVVPNLWGCVVGRPSLKKTPATKGAERQLRNLEGRSREALADEIDDAEVDAMLLEPRRKLLENNMKTAIKSGDEDAARSYASELKGLVETKPPEPRRIIAKETSIQKLCEMLSRHPAGMILFIDELLGWMRKLDRDDQAGVRPIYLTLWNGTEIVNDDTLGRGELSARGCISVFGCFTPGGLTDYVSAAIRGGRGDDGLVQRLQITVWPDSPKEYHPVDRWPDGAAKEQLRKTFEELADIDAKAIGDTDKHDDDGIPFLHFDADGQVLFNAWDESHQRRLRREDLPEAFESHLSKYASMVPSIALLVHLASGGRGAVSGVATSTAIRWAEYLESHAQRLYAVATSPQRQHAGPLLRRLLTWPTDTPIRVASIVKRCWSGLTTKVVVEETLGLLADAGWVQSIKVDTGGRPTMDWLVHPEAAKYLATTENRAIKTPERPTQGTFDGFEGSDSCPWDENENDEIEVTV